MEWFWYIIASIGTGIGTGFAGISRRFDDNSKLLECLVLIRKIKEKGSDLLPYKYNNR